MGHRRHGSFVCLIVHTVNVHKLKEVASFEYNFNYMIRNIVRIVELIFLLF